MYIVANQLENMVLTNSGGSLYTAARAPQHNRDANQLWDIRELSNGEWGVIYSKYFDTVLDVMYSNTKEGATVITYKKTSGNNQLWKYENGFIISKLNDFAMQIKDAKRVFLSSVKQSARHQKWSFQYPHKRGRNYCLV